MDVVPYMKGETVPYAHLYGARVPHRYDYPGDCSFHLSTPSPVAAVVVIRDVQKSGRCNGVEAKCNERSESVCVFDTCYSPCQHSG